MKIFNVILNGIDAKWFCKLSKQEKIDWIVKNSNQKNTETIIEFLLLPIESTDCGCGCGGSKLETNESSRISETIVKNYELVSNSRDNGKDNSSRRKKLKNT